MPTESRPKSVPSVYVSHSEEETLNFARCLAGSLTRPVRVLLRGELGAGKTTFTRGLAAGFGVADPGEVSSPTFTLINRYQGHVPVYHVDLYRVDSDDLYDLGLEEILEEPDSVTIIEWAERLGEVFAEANVVNVSLFYIGEQSRRIEVEPEPQAEPLQLE